MSEPLLQVRDLVVEFRTANGPLRAVDGVSLDVARGERVGIVGESGSGKSVLSRTAMGLLGRKDARISGEITFRGQDLLAMSDKQRRDLWGREIAMVFQDPLSSLHPITPVGQQIVETLRRDPAMDKTKARARAIELLDMVGIPQAERRFRSRAHELSGGMRQRVMIAIAVANSPSLLFADEPTTALDVTVQARILELFDELCRELSIGLVMVSHDLGVVARHTDAVSVMYAGRISEQGTVDDVLRSPRMRYTSALLAAIPRIDHGRRALPQPIGGLPPDLVNPPAGCRFAPRCAHAVAACADQVPPLEPAADVPGHAFACWNPTPTEVAR
ncbi:ABC transporter ATP-binding protein [Pimelobacter simplex]|uniref:Oligopeptide ABC transporter ATP-binding protein n=1 Tax=Nocardioides simplex TaxID=2045 RepID=A0A0A1DEQ6_NOCSI|nr:ABC transporter ATP-binding protein [Pimelobacter simplex]AIY15696.1 oligopeptide ABC transporter ATP-binding protein [Pimelobacter simplex]GEB15031.1 ABC transporter ATP-binding protein [Pimelobacter simplex]SFM87360.1 peptide/nickel transport system ATP-binding protein [Pimelobacter simplex]